MDEDEIEGLLGDALNEALRGSVKEPLKIQDIHWDEKNVKSYLCRIVSNSQTNPIVAEFLFEKHGLMGGYFPGEYRVASWSSGKTPTSIYATAYPRGGLIGTSLGPRNFVFIPAYSHNIRQFNSDEIYREKRGWFPLMDTLDQDDYLKRWLREMPLNTAAGKRTLTMEFGTPKDIWKCFGQLTPMKLDDTGYKTAIGFRAIPHWKSRLISGRVNDLELSYLKTLTLIIGRIDDHVLHSDYKDKIYENTPVANRRLFRLSAEAFSPSI